MGFVNLPEGTTFTISTFRAVVLRGRSKLAATPSWQTCLSRGKRCGDATRGGMKGDGARWAPTSYKWSYNPYKWLYKGNWRY